MALQQIIDRRLAGKNKSIGNRERFLRRYREQIKEAVRKAVGDRSITDMEEGADITLPKRDVSEPTFGHAPGGSRELVHPGNEEYVRGDRIQRPQGGGGGGSGSGDPKPRPASIDINLSLIPMLERERLCRDWLEIGRRVGAELAPQNANQLHNTTSSLS